MILQGHEGRRNSKYIKHNDFDISDIHFKIFNNRIIENYRNRFNINDANTVISKFNTIQFKLYCNIGGFGIFGGYHYLRIKKDPIEVIKLKMIIRWRLKNYYSRRGVVNEIDN